MQVGLLDHEITQCQALFNLRKVPPGGRFRAVQLCTSARATIAPMTEQYKELLAAARQARTRAYCPYSEYSVGSSVLMGDGSVYLGCNVENANYTSTICAERTAFVKAISDGKRDFKVVAVATKAPDAWPCGLCRQFIAEFGQDIVVIVESPDGGINKMTIGELLPNRIEPVV